jgi:hypothetical protein
VEFNLSEAPKSYESTKECRKLGAAIAALFEPAGPVDIRLTNEVGTKSVLVPYEPLRPELPLTYETRSSIGGGSLVFRVKNTSDRFLQIQGSARDLTVGEWNHFTLELPPGKWFERGWVEGNSFHSGDEVWLRHPDYEDFVIKLK